MPIATTGEERWLLLQAFVHAMGASLVERTPVAARLTHLVLRRQLDPMLPPTPWIGRRYRGYELLHVRMLRVLDDPHRGSLLGSDTLEQHHHLVAGVAGPLEAEQLLDHGISHRTRLLVALGPQVTVDQLEVGLVGLAPEQGDGVIQAFRREQCAQGAITLRLSGMDPEALYRLTDLDREGTTEARGKDLMGEGLKVEIGEAPGSAIVMYRRVP